MTGEQAILTQLQSLTAAHQEQAQELAKLTGRLEERCLAESRIVQEHHEALFGERGLKSRLQAQEHAVAAHLAAEGRRNAWAGAAILAALGSVGERFAAWFMR